MFKRQRDKLAHHFRASAEAGFVDLRWRTTEAGGLRFRLLRSERDYPSPSDAPTAEPLWEGTDSAYQDRAAVARDEYPCRRRAAMAYRSPEVIW